MNISAEARPRVLYVDDDQALLRSVQRQARRWPFALDISSDPREALQLAASESYAAVAVDYMMPHLNGLELVERLQSVQPQATYVLISGVVGLAELDRLVADTAIAHTLAKPVPQNTLRQTLDACVEAAGVRIAADLGKDQTPAPISGRPRAALWDVVHALDGLRIPACPYVRCDGAQITAALLDKLLGDARALKGLSAYIEEVRLLEADHPWQGGPLSLFSAPASSPWDEVLAVATERLARYRKGSSLHALLVEVDNVRRTVSAALRQTVDPVFARLADNNAEMGVSDPLALACAARFLFATSARSLPMCASPYAEGMRARVQEAYGVLEAVIDQADHYALWHGARRSVLQLMRRFERWLSAASDGAAGFALITDARNQLRKLGQRRLHPSLGLHDARVVAETLHVVGAVRAQPWGTTMRRLNALRGLDAELDGFISSEHGPFHPVLGRRRLAELLERMQDELPRVQ